MKLLRADFLGTHVHAVTHQALVARVAGAVASRTRLIVGHHNLNSLALLPRHSEMRGFYDCCGLVYADGMPVVTLARLFGYDFSRAHRITSLDFINDILALAAAQRWKVFYLGSTADVVSIAADKFRARHPGLQIAVRSGYFNPETTSVENRRVVGEINAYGPDLLIVGMGMPRQEAWVLGNHREVNATVLFAIGALADYVAGAIPTPPRWSGRVGLEWIFRLWAEPRRLARRYLIDPWTLLGPVIRERWHRRANPPGPGTRNGRR